MGLFSQVTGPENEELGRTVHPLTMQQADSPVSPKVNAADAQVVTRTDVARLQLQGPAVCSHCFFTLVSIGQGGSQLIPQQVVLG